MDESSLFHPPPLLDSSFPIITSHIKFNKFILILGAIKARLRGPRELLAEEGRAQRSELYRRTTEGGTERDRSTNGYQQRREPGGHRYGQTTHDLRLKLAFHWRDLAARLEIDK